MICKKIFLKVVVVVVHESSRHGGKDSVLVIQRSAIKSDFFSKSFSHLHIFSLRNGMFSDAFRFICLPHVKTVVYFCVCNLVYRQ